MVYIVYIERCDIVSSMDVIREKLEQNLGKTVYLKADRGRKRYITRKGTIEEVHPSLFVVNLEFEDAPNRMLSFTYADVLTETVQLRIIEDDADIK